MHLERPVQMQLWIAGIAICVLVVSAIFAIVRSITISHANPPGRNATATQEVGPLGPDDTRIEDRGLRNAVAETSSDRRNRFRCRECGVVKSISKVERYGDIGRQDRVDAAAERRPGGAGAPESVTAKSYHVTIRLRDGSTMAFNEATRRDWRTGSQVIVIAGSNPSID